MNEIQELQSTALLSGLARRLKSVHLSRPIVAMEVCGTHTMAVHRGGLTGLLPPKFKLLSGPGCPVCVTPPSYLDTAFAMAREHSIVLTTFGDMMRVPGTSETLTDLRCNGYPVEIVYSPLGALELARQNPAMNVVFLAIGFETTAPAVAATIKCAQDHQIGNFSILSAHKLVIPALRVLVDDPDLAVDGFILPGHVSIMLGSEPYRFLAEKYNRACVITGFEYTDIIQGILMLIEQIEKRDIFVGIQYSRFVRPEGNQKSRRYLEEVFATVDTNWRGFGTVPDSGLILHEEFADFDALVRYPTKIPYSKEPEGCRCGAVLRGYTEPPECPLFGSVCMPENPVGPCMVATEGTCSAFYQNLSDSIWRQKAADSI